MMRTFVLISVAFLLISCSSDDKFEIPDHILEMDHLIVIPADEESSFRIEFVRDRVLFGQKIQDPLPGQPGPMVVDYAGRVLVSDYATNQIHQFDSDGGYITTIGRSGSGPGEFSTAPTLVIVEDRLLALDSMQNRLSRYCLDTLEFIDTMNLNLHSIEEDGVFSPFQIFAINDTLLLVAYNELNVTIPNPGQRIETIRPHYLISNGQPDKRLFETPGYIWLTGEVEGQTRQAVYPFHSRSVLRISMAGEIYLAMSDEFLINVYDSDGVYRRAYYTPFRRVGLNREEILRNEHIQMRRQILAQHETPDEWPALRSMMIDDENRLWISTIVEDFDIYEWWVLEETGELIARFGWARAEPIEVIRNGFIYTRETDPETGIQQIVRYRIELEER